MTKWQIAYRGQSDRSDRVAVSLPFEAHGGLCCVQLKCPSNAFTAVTRRRSISSTPVTPAATTLYAMLARHITGLGALGGCVALMISVP